MRRLTSEDKIIDFKILATLKLSLISKVPSENLSELKRIQKSFLWPFESKTINETLCSDFTQDGLKNVNIQKKIIVFNALE